MNMYPLPSWGGILRGGTVSCCCRNPYSVRRVYALFLSKKATDGVWCLLSVAFRLRSALSVVVCLQLLLFKVHPFSCDGVAEAEAFGMEVEAVGGGAIEDVALDGASKPFGVGAVDAQLVGAA